MNRRDFSKKLLGATALIAASKHSLRAEPGDVGDTDKLSVHLFSKMIQFLDFEEMSAAANEMGFDGLDLTVRPGGHVEPNRVSKDLPKAVEAMKRHSLRPRLITTCIKEMGQPYSLETLERVSELGFEAYRMGWYKFDEPIEWKANLDRIKEEFKVLESINKALKIHGAYQNHSGNYVGALASDVAYLLSDSEPEWMGCQFDIRHATVEAGLAWPIAVKALRKYAKTIVVKDFKWSEKDGRPIVVNTPLGEGIVQFDRYFKMLREFGQKPLVSLHAEYLPHWKNVKPEQRQEIYARLKRDLETLHRLWSESR